MSLVDLLLQSEKQVCLKTACMSKSAGHLRTPEACIVQVACIGKTDHKRSMNGKKLKDTSQILHECAAYIA